MLVFERSNDAIWAYTGIVITSISFMFFLLILGSSLIINMRNQLIKYSLWGTFFISCVGLFLCISIGIRTASSFNEEVEVDKTVHGFYGDSLEIQTKSFGFGIPKEVNLELDGDHAMTIQNKRVILQGIEMSFKHSRDSSFHIRHHLSARGFTSKTAFSRIKTIEFGTRLNGNKLIVPSYFSFPITDRLRSQEIELIVEVPIGKALFVNGKRILFSKDSETSQTDEYLGGGNIDIGGQYSGY